jgi:hypothetical protein
MSTDLQIVFAVGACLGLAQSPIAMQAHRSPSHCVPHDNQPAPEKALAGCHACTLPRPNDEDDD